jgi:hypothetical protein
MMKSAVFFPWVQICTHRAQAKPTQANEQVEIGKQQVKLKTETPR